ncbi:MAG TPA: GNAT family N-acetyltransferase [Candidatus Babeliales bacterium]|nr:GNAT family N-acetyltransferase [Candidatus Babeliales bacterium]
MPPIYNLIVELDRDFAADPPAGIEIGAASPADERTLSWIDDEFGGAWSSEAYAGINVIARRGGAPLAFATVDAKGLKFAWLDGKAGEPDVGLFGPFGVAASERGHGLGRCVLAAALNELRRRGYARALVAAVGDERLLQFYANAAGARVAERFERASLHRPARRALIMASGHGSNFQAVLDASRSGTLALEIAGLLVNNPRAYALDRARDAGMSAVLTVVWEREKETRDAYDARLLEAARSARPDLVLLLGWMHLLSESFVREFGQMLNLHPAFLPLDPRRDDVVTPNGARIPAFRGPRAVRDALATSSPWVGATIHRVTAATDRGPVMARKPLRVEPEETEAHLMQRVHEVERGVVNAGIRRWIYER